MKFGNYLVDTEPFGTAASMVHMIARKGHTPVSSFILHLANHTSVYITEIGLEQTTNQGKAGISFL